MANFNDLKARYSIVFDKLSQIEDLSEVSSHLSSLDEIVATVENFVNTKIGADVEATVDTPSEAPADVPSEEVPADPAPEAPAPEAPAPEAPADEAPADAPAETPSEPQV
jgi:hypothetical protein